MIYIQPACFLLSSSLDHQRASVQYVTIVLLSLIAFQFHFCQVVARLNPERDQARVEIGEVFQNSVNRSSVIEERVFKTMINIVVLK